MGSAHSDGVGGADVSSHNGGLRPPGAGLTAGATPRPRGGAAPLMAEAEPALAARPYVGGGRTRASAAHAPDKKKYQTLVWYLFLKIFFRKFLKIHRV